MGRRGLLHDTADALCRRAVQVRVGLVQDEHLGVAGTGRSQGDEGLLTPGEGRDLRIKEVGDADRPCSRSNPLIGLPAGSVTEPGSRRDLVVYPGEEERPVGELPHPPDLHGRRRSPEEPDRPSPGLLDAGADRKKRRLAAPVRPDHGDVTRIHSQIGDIEQPVPEIGDADHATRFPMVYAAVTFTTSPTANGATPSRTA